MKSPFFNEKHEALRKSVRNFVEKEISPNAQEWEKSGRIPRETWLKMGEEKFLGINYSKKFGGLEADFFSSVVFLEELTRSAMGGFSAAVNMHQFMALAYVERFASEALQKKYLSAGIAGKRIGALALAEPNVSSDVSEIKTRAVREKNNYVLNGSKSFVINGIYGDFVIVAAKTDPEAGASGISLFIVDSNTDGFSSRKLEKVGWQSADTAELSFKNVRVPAANLIGEENMGFYYIMECYQLERLIAAVTSVASAEFCLEHTLEYLAERKKFDHPSSHFQSTRHALSDLATEIEAARRLTYFAAWQYGRGEQALKECTMAKLFSTELAKKVADECLQCFGEFGYTSDYLISRLYRDARISTLVGGSTDIMREIVSKLVIDDFEFRSPSVSLLDAPDADESSPDLPLVQETVEELNAVEPEEVEKEAKVVVPPVEVEGGSSEKKTAKVKETAKKTASQKEEKTVEDLKESKKKGTAKKPVEGAPAEEPEVAKAQQKSTKDTGKKVVADVPADPPKPAKPITDPVKESATFEEDISESIELVETEEVSSADIATEEDVKKAVQQAEKAGKETPEEIADSIQENTDPTILSEKPLPQSSKEPRIDVTRLKTSSEEVTEPVISGKDPKSADETILAAPSKQANGHSSPADARTAPPPAPTPKARRSVPPPRLGKRQHAPKTTKHDIHSVQDIFDGMPHRFRPEKAGEYRTVFHFRLSGEQGGEYTVKIFSGQCTVEDGLSGDPRCVVETSDKTYMDIELGKTNPQVAFMMGKVKVSNIPEMTHFGKVFRKLHGT
ncbi:MAG: acyl-CoA dehydrogenase family protein [Calditrichia bacterium]